MIRTWLAGAAISCRLVIAVGKGVLKANNSTMLMKTGSPFKLTEDWARIRCIKVFRMNDRKGGAPRGKSNISEKNFHFGCRA